VKEIKSEISSKIEIIDESKESEVKEEVKKEEEKKEENKKKPNDKYKINFKLEGLIESKKGKMYKMNAVCHSFYIVKEKD
jgi:hypothetical protein